MLCDAGVGACISADLEKAPNASSLVPCKDQVDIGWGSGVLTGRTQ